MKGYVRIPIFSANNERVGYIRIMIIDRELNNIFNTSFATTDGNPAYFPCVKYLATSSPYYSSVGAAIGVDSTGTTFPYNPTSFERAVGLNGIMRSALEELFNSSVSAAVSSDSEYNLVALFKKVGNGTFHSKDNKIVITFSTNTDSYGTRHTLQLGGYQRAWYDSDFAIAGEGYRNDNDLSYFEAQSAVNNSSGRSAFRYGLFIGLHILDDCSGINLNRYGAAITKHGSVAKQDSKVGYTYGGYACWYISSDISSRIWGDIIDDSEGNIIKQLEDTLDGEFNEEFEDDDNTYPGGGDDKNTYPPDGESGKGTFDDTNDPIDFPSMPTWDATSTGFISMWNPTISEISQLYGFLWDSDISTTLKKLFLEPMDAIISLAFFPVDPINFPEKRNVTIGHVDTEITMYAVQKQFVDFDFGTITLDEYYGAAWDYSPYTKVSIYLPYIGSQELDVDDVMNANLHLQYRIDLLSGMCAAMLKCTRDRDDLDAIIYTWQGNCAMQVPITAGSAREFINSIIQIGAMTGLALVQPAAGAINAIAHAGEEGYSNPSTAGQWVSPAMATYSALNVLGQKVHVQRGGRVDANAGVMSPQSAYLIIDRPISAIPKGWNEYAGYPSLKIKALSTQKGMTQVAYIKLNGLEATAEEISELDNILKAGVIL